jgi:diacylglycerol kinase (ATP)
VNDNDRLFLIVNPSSGRGRGASLLEPVLQVLRSEGRGVEHAMTEQAGDEACLVEQAINSGFGTIVAVGGDGTWSNVANSILRSGAPVRLGLIPGGTGCDLIKSLGFPDRDAAACARVVLAGHSRTIDVGRIENKYFLNVAGFGYDTAVIEHSWRVRFLRGELLYLYCALRQIYSFPGFRVEMGTDGQPTSRHDLLMLIIANGHTFGGTFRIAPRARLDDGQLDAMAFSNMGLLERLGTIRRLIKGSHEAARAVSGVSAASFQLRFAAPPAYETDGEWNRAASAELDVTSIPRALRVLAPVEA